MNLNGVNTYLMTYMTTNKDKLRTVTLTHQEWLDAIHTPGPHKNKKKYTRKKKHKNKDNE